MLQLLRSELPFAAASGDKKTSGLYAETHADGSISKVALWRDGRLVTGITITENAAWLETVEHFEQSSSKGDDPDGFKTWIDAALRDLSRRAEGVQACAFCEKTSAEVAKLIMGPRQGICNECVALCNNILIESAPAA